jgi:hypothetical protein
MSMLYKAFQSVPGRTERSQVNTSAAAHGCFSTSHCQRLWPRLRQLHTSFPREHLPQHHGAHTAQGRAPPATPRTARATQRDLFTDGPHTLAMPDAQHLAHACSVAACAWETVRSQQRLVLRHHPQREYVPSMPPHAALLMGCPTQGTRCLPPSQWAALHRAHAACCTAVKFPVAFSPLAPAGVPLLPHARSVGPRGAASAGCACATPSAHPHPVVASAPGHHRKLYPINQSNCVQAPISSPKLCRARIRSTSRLHKRHCLH